MFTLVRTLGPRQWAVEQLPVLATSFVIAELFYKFKSFTLECLAFIATWYLLDFAVQTLSGRGKGSAER